MVKNEFLAWICTTIMILGKNIAPLSINNLQCITDVLQNHGITMVGISNPRNA